mgnify:CR=1 FL=1
MQRHVPWRAGRVCRPSRRLHWRQSTGFCVEIVALDFGKPCVRDVGRPVARMHEDRMRRPVPGGDFPHDGVDALVEQTLQRWPFLSDDHARRLTRAYGTRVENVLKDASGIDDLGQRFGADLTAAEVRYLMDREWARTADDVLWRRSKLGLRLSSAQRDQLEDFMGAANR